MSLLTYFLSLEHNIAHVFHVYFLSLTQYFRRYQTAQILLHSLSQQVNGDDDRRLLNKYKEAVEKRLFVLQSQGIVMAYDNTA